MTLTEEHIRQSKITDGEKWIWTTKFDLYNDKNVYRIDGSVNEQAKKYCDDLLVGAKVKPHPSHKKNKDFELHKILSQLSEKKDKSTIDNTSMKWVSKVTDGAQAAVLDKVFKSGSFKRPVDEEPLDPEAEAKKLKREEAKAVRDQKAAEKKEQEEEAERDGTTDYAAKAKAWLIVIKGSLTKASDTNRHTYIQTCRQ
jgi:hypothetical protein